MIASVVAVASIFGSGGGKTWPQSGHSRVPIGTMASQPGQIFAGGSAASPSPLPFFSSGSAMASTGPCRITLPAKSSTRQSSLPGATRMPRPAIWM